MGLHTGAPIRYESGYAGLDVHRAARIAGVAHGGQIVVSATTAALINGSLDASPRLRDLGNHRLKDLPSREHLFQVDVPGLPCEFPPLKSLGASVTLPRTGTPLVGRERELNDVESMLTARETSLVTLTGPGGAGKTRLAVAVARRLVERFSGGVYFVPLASATSAQTMWATIGEVLNVPPEARLPPRLFEHLAGRESLAVLDNLEQIAGADEVVAELSNEAKSMTLLATSRHPLQLEMEYQYPVPPLPVPPVGELPVERALGSGAVEMFVERARRVHPQFEVTAENVSDVAALCRRLDGLPLAIELAASRANLLSPGGLLARIDRGLDVAAKGSDRPVRHRTLRDTLDWSYQLLPAAHQRIFRRLGVFAGGADLEAVAAVMDEDSASDVAAVYDALDELVDASLAVVSATTDDLRIGMLETVRAYARDAMRTSGEIDDVGVRHARHYLELARRLRPSSLDPQKVAATLDRFELEHDNFREALAWALPTEAETDVDDDRAVLGLRLCLALGRIWYVTGNFAEASGWQESAIQHAGGSDSDELARVLTMLGNMLHEQADQFDLAQKFKSASVDMWRRLGQPGPLAFALAQLGSVEAELGQSDVAREHLEEAVTIARESSEPGPLSWALGYLAYYESCERQVPLSLRLFDEALNVSQAQPDPRREWILTMGRACALRLSGSAEESAAQLRSLIPSALTFNDPQTLSVLGECYAAALSQLDRAREAVRLLGAADATRERLMTRRPPLHEREVEESISRSRATLTAQEWDEAYQAGRSMLIRECLAGSPDPYPRSGNKSDHSQQA
jgi:predicted ATPase